MNKSLLLLLIAMLPVRLRAEIYKCGDTWQNSPCEGAAAEQSFAEVKRAPPATEALSKALLVKPELRDTERYLLFIPGELAQGKPRPLVVALSPSADPSPLIDAWRTAAQQMKWLVYGSKTHKNGVPMQPILEQLVHDVESLTRELPIDRSKVIVTGFSGGGMASHAMTVLHPRLAAGIVINTGMMAGWQRARARAIPRGKLGVFLASPTDFRYQEMKRDFDLLRGQGWKLKWIEFAGGHSIAPPAVYSEAARWLDGQW